jgi:hypothetical protein
MLLRRASSTECPSSLLRKFRADKFFYRPHAKGRFDANSGVTTVPGCSSQPCDREWMTALDLSAVCSDRIHPCPMRYSFVGEHSSADLGRLGDAAV